MAFIRMPQPVQPIKPIGRPTIMGKNFIKGAIKHPGALHKELGVPQGQKIPAKKMASAASKGGLLGKRARFAEELKGFAHEKKPKADGTY
jgi:hypothetical protein